MRRNKITVFTPTYNRRQTIGKTYQSLCSQTYKEFEWIVIDDGCDETDQLISACQAEGIIDILYIRNTGERGINRAFNQALQMASGAVFMKVDDDDWLREDALAQIIRYENGIPDKKNFAGVAGLRAHFDGSAVGDAWRLKGAFVDATGFERRKLGLMGDKAEAYYTDVLRKYGPMDVTPGETYTWEGILWDRIAHAGLKIRWFNEMIYYCEYLDDGATANEEKARRSNFISYAKLIGQRAGYSELGIILRLKEMCRFFEAARELDKTPSDVKAYFGCGNVMLYLCYAGSFFTKWF